MLSIEVPTIISFSHIELVSNQADAFRDERVMQQVLSQFGTKNKLSPLKQ